MVSSLAKPLHSSRESPLIPILTVGFPVSPQHHFSLSVIHILDMVANKQQTVTLDKVAQRDPADHNKSKNYLQYKPPAPPLLIY